MARRKKKLNAGVGIFSAIIFFMIGIVAGILGKIYVFPGETYIIPDTINSTSGVSAGDLNAEVIKQEDLSIHFLELGNKYTGDSTFIKAGDTEILIDAGSRTSSIEPIHDYITDYISDGELEYVIVTHAHRDHYAGFATSNSLFDALAESDIVIGEVITFSLTNQDSTKGLYKAFLDELDELVEENNTQISNVLDYFNGDGTKTNIDLNEGVELEFLYHKYYETEASSENDYSVCFMINQEVIGDTRHYLFTGDLEEDGEADLIINNTLPKVDVYKAGHHGSKTSSSEAFLTVIDPDIVCICCCAGSPEYTSTKSNQFPTQQFIDRIAEFTDAIYVTTICIDYEKAIFESMNGYIVVTSSKNNAVAVSCSASTSKLKDTEWFKTNRTTPNNWK